LKEAVRMTPGAGLMIKQVRDDISGKNGPQARATMYGRWLVGSAVYSAVVLATAAGKMGGAGPERRRTGRPQGEAIASADWLAAVLGETRG
jgi:hypothetical protein